MAELFRHGANYLTEMFRHGANYLTEQFRRIAPLIIIIFVSIHQFTYFQLVIFLVSSCDENSFCDEQVAIDDDIRMKDCNDNEGRSKVS